MNGEVLPVSFLEEHGVSICGPCKTIMTAQGCPVCKGKRRFRPPPTAMVVEEQLPRPDATAVTPELKALIWRILRTNAATLKHIPKAFRSTCAYEIKQLMTAANAGDDLYNLCRLTLFPRVVLAPLPQHRGGYRGRAQARSILGKRLQQWRTTSLAMIVQNLLATPSARRADNQAALADLDVEEEELRRLQQRINLHVASGSLSKAAKEVVSSGLHPPPQRS